jgi:DNA-binding winged helix-turn-helix (wHTH) protein
MRLRFDGFVLDTERMDLSRGGVSIRLTPRAFRLLSRLAEQRPRAVSKRDLLDHVWSGTIVDEANLKTLVLEIRKALEDRGGSSDCIRTVFGFGYAFECDASEEIAPVVTGPLVRVETRDRVVLLPQGVHEIGRRPGCAVFIDASSVSRVHARLHVGPDTLLIEDNASKNGTFVGGVRIVEPVSLPAHSHVVCGDVDVLLERMGSEPSETTTIDPA